MSMTTRTQSIAYPKEPVLVMHPSLVSVCDGDCCAAALLSFLTYWRDRNFDSWKAKNFVGKPTEKDLIQYHSSKDLEAGICGMYGKDKVRVGLDLLASKKFITVTKNPNRRFSYDQKKHFLVHPNAINAALAKLAAAGHQAPQPAPVAPMPQPLAPQQMTTIPQPIAPQWPAYVQYAAANQRPN